jgi:peroxiredoxin
MLQRSRNVFDQSTPLLVGTKINLPSLQTSQGESYNFSNQENQRYMILYFRTDCKFCHLDLPLWKEIHSQSTHLNTNVIAITEESDIDLVSAFANENDLPFPVLMDPEHKLLGQLKFPVTPTKVLISDEQRVAQVWRGLTTQQSGDADVGGLVATFGIEPTLLPQSADVNIR